MPELGSLTELNASTLWKFLTTCVCTSVVRVSFVSYQWLRVLIPGGLIIFIKMSKAICTNIKWVSIPISKDVIPAGLGILYPYTKPG